MILAGNNAVENLIVIQTLPISQFLGSKNACNPDKYLWPTELDLGYLLCRILQSSPREISTPMLSFAIICNKPSAEEQQSLDQFITRNLACPLRYYLYVPLGAGVALAMKYRKQENVCVDMYGDGAANQGQVFEAFNLAKLWKLPVIFLCENNKYGMGTADCRSSACIDYYTRASYIPGLWVNGMDVLSVREAIRFCRDWIMEGNGPIVFEAETYRYFGHSMSDPGTSYRTRDEVDLVRKQRDPINLFCQSVVSAGLLTDAEIKEINAVVKKEVAQDSDQAETNPEPDVELAYEHVHKQPIPGFPIRGCDILDVH
ncbi:pyruvate dehydrogenase E1 component subunit alpha domain protein [Opisthorchis viverrini]|uniref:Pyruvate dehydrogenase E1 component subunit alpha domain protein n=1 Tax=Opisthorchis viverrini TaxID=6198 RepID=A0A1S8X3T8_OPIVI|nr:pyruvate dehydrogenase E1 component subunit alpha domain protein [Opisthorchis viverrini]